MRGSSWLSKDRLLCVCWQPGYTSICLTSNSTTLNAGREVFGITCTANDGWGKIWCLTNCQSAIYKPSQHLIARLAACAEPLFVFVLLAGWLATTV